MSEDRRCSFFDLCEECHPEKEMSEKRNTCNDKNCKKCGVYWAFLDGYLALEELES